MSRATITIHLDEPIGRIRPELHGQFVEHLGSCVDGGIWVGEASKIPNENGLRVDVLEALRKIRPPVVRWPGGCFADDYHWTDGIGPRADRPRRVNVWWGESIETNGFGTHEFMMFCRAIGAQPYLGGNVGSGTPRELRDWVEYCKFAGDSALARRRAANGSPHPFDVRLWGVGNESWGCGGNFTPEDYAAEYRRFATYLRDFGGRPLQLIACGPDGNDHDWTRRFLAKATAVNPRWNVRIAGLAAHYYCGTAGPSATEFDVNDWTHLLAKAAAIETLIHEQRALMDEFDPQRRIGLVIDEWGTWHFPTSGKNPNHLWQQSSLRDALVAAITLDTFNRHANIVTMANIAQMANVLQSLLLTEGDRLVLTPTYHVFDLYQPHQGALSQRLTIKSPPVVYVESGERKETPALSASASRKHGRLTLSVVNAHPALPIEAELLLRGGEAGEGTLHLLTQEELTAHNTFDDPQAVKPTEAPYAASGSTWPHRFPPASVSVFNLPIRAVNGG